MDTALIMLACTAAIIGAFHIGRLYGQAEGGWGPAAMRRLTAAREDAFANGVRYGRALTDPETRIPLDQPSQDRLFRPFLEAAE